MGRGRHVVGVQPAHGVDVLEDGRQLQRHSPDLVVVEGEPGEACHVTHLARV